jgi:hypothetical protein
MIQVLELEDYTGRGRNNLTVRGELNKLAANIAIGRNMAGVHYRSGYMESLRLGEQIANWHTRRTASDYV